METTERVTKDNALIAEFMGAEFANHNYQPNPYWEFWQEQPPTNAPYIFDIHLKYHSSWDWLMPVIEKIETLKYSVTITQNICTIQAAVMGDRTVVSHETGNYMEADTKLSNTYKAVVEFIKWRKAEKS